jgi:hypothetical protein
MNVSLQDVRGLAAGPPGKPLQRFCHSGNECVVHGQRAIPFHAMMPVSR